LVSAMDAGFMFGDGLFETMRSYNGRVFALDAHLNRLAAGAKAIDINNLPSNDALALAIEATIRANFAIDTVIRMTATRGKPTAIDPTVIIQTREIVYKENEYRQGVACVTAPEPRGSLSRYKTLNYLPNMMARREAAKAGYFEALFVGETGQMTEGASTSIFAITDGILRTPPLGCGILNGVTRRVVLDIARTTGQEAREEALSLGALFASEELFVTNSVMEIMPVVSVNNRQVGLGKPGPETLKLLKLYRSRVGQAGINR
jgi:branched-chain amino acid aminotransferase